MLIFAVPMETLPENSVAAQAWNFVAQIVSLLISPIVLIYVYNIYTDLVKVKK